MEKFSSSLEVFSAKRMAEVSFMIIGERYIPPASKKEMLRKARTETAKLNSAIKSHNIKKAV